MNKDELLLKLSDLEWEDFEVKAAKAELPKNTWETVSAFSNTSGGWILFGVSQHGLKFEIQGVENVEKIEQDFLNTIRGGKMNVFVPTRQIKYAIDGKIVLGFYVPVSKEKPVYYNSLQNTFIRRGSSDQRATSEEIDIMFRDQTFGTKTSEIAIGTNRDSINNSSLTRYRDYMARFNPNVGYNRFDEVDFLRKLRIMDGDQCTYGGLLFLGNRDAIERHFPNFRVDLLEIPGTSYSDAETRYTFRLDEYDNLWEYYFECVTRLRSKVDVEYKMGSEGFALDLSPGFSALREALVNMLMHADHFSPACPRIRIFTDHIEFYNPGGLPKPLEELKEKDISLPRNPIITKLFRMVKLAENAGYGLDNIVDNWNKYNQTSPEFDVEFDSVVVRFQLGKSDKQPMDKHNHAMKDYGKITERLRKEFETIPVAVDSIMELLNINYKFFTNFLVENIGIDSEKVRKHFGDTSETVRRHFGDKTVVLLLLILINKDITAIEASKIIGVSARTIEKYIVKLKSHEIIERIGSDFGGYWTIKK